MYSIFKTTIIICALTVTITAAALSLADFERSVQYIRDTEPARLQKLGYSCPECSKVHGAQGPVMGAAGLPVIAAGYGVYLLRPRRRR